MQYLRVATEAHARLHTLAKPLQLVEVPLLLWRRSIDVARNDDLPTDDDLSTDQRMGDQFLRTGRFTLLRAFERRPSGSSP